MHPLAVSLRRSWHVGFCLLLAVAALSVHATEAVAGESGDPVFTLRTEQTNAPINPFIYGQFVEHLGRCIYGGIWAEMLEDRKFFFPVVTHYDPYRQLTNSPFPVVGASPWQIIGPASAVSMQEQDSFVGRWTPVIEPGAGIRQRDLGLIGGKTYTGYVWLEAPEGVASVEVALTWGEEATDRSVHSIRQVRPGFRKQSFVLTAGTGTDEGNLELRVEGADVRVGTVSLMPADHVRGMRADTLTLLRQLGATMYRWPGGNFVSGYDWRDGVGDRDRRPPRRNPAWTGVEHNDFGLDEFLSFCAEVAAEPVIAVNTGFGDAASAALEVEYCNGAPNTPGGGMRTRNGHREPYGVKVWCVGNEMFGPWQLGFMQLQQYTEKHNRFAARMREVDPSVQLIGVGDLGRINSEYDPKEKRGWSRGMLEACAESMDLISEHFYRGRTQESVLSHAGQLAAAVRQKAEGHRKLQTELGYPADRLMPIALDEWNYWHHPYVYGELGCVYDLSDALGVAACLHEFFRQSDIVQMAHYAQTVNVIGCIKTTKTQAFFSTTALPLMLYRHQFGTIPITLEGDPSQHQLDVVAAWVADRKALTVGAVNPHPEARRIGLKLSAVTITEGATLWTITGNDPGLHNEPGNAAVRIAERRVAFEDGLELPPFSISLIRLPVAD